MGARHGDRSLLYRAGWVGGDGARVDEHGHRVVHVAGELGLASRDLVEAACCAGESTAVIVDLAETTFLDCSGFGGLMAARCALDTHGGSLSIRNQTQQPRWVLGVIARIERGGRTDTADEQAVWLGR